MGRNRFGNKRTLVALIALYILVELARRILALTCKRFDLKKVIIDWGCVSATAANLITWYFVSYNVISISKLV